MCTIHINTFRVKLTVRSVHDSRRIDFLSLLLMQINHYILVVFQRTRVRAKCFFYQNCKTTALVRCSFLGIKNVRVNNSTCFSAHLAAVDTILFYVEPTSVVISAADHVFVIKCTRTINCTINVLYTSINRRDV